MYCLAEARRVSWEKPIFLRAMQTNLNVQIQDSGAPLEGCQEEVNLLSVLQSCLWRITELGQNRVFLGF